MELTHWHRSNSTMCGYLVDDDCSTCGRMEDSYTRMP